MDKITYEVLEKLGVLSESPRGWTKELRLVNWNNRGPRYDLREWSPGDRKASRGITLSLREMRVLQEVLMETEFPEPEDEDEAVGEGMDNGMMGLPGSFSESGSDYAGSSEAAAAAVAAATAAAANKAAKRERRAS
ncbi:MAG: PC4/YdbC family ssDNA-binding protein [Clostridiales bacterium]|nr:PC4/YdbC family ssDNA-binding protein [Clostridiales bacterium]